jgi:16S rRNA (guanine(1405)-N(7))-methyltransferase
MTPKALNTQQLTEKILNSRKYRASGLNPHTIEDLIRQEAPHHPSQKALLKSVRRKLHNIVAPYLGEPDYPALLARLATLPYSALDDPQLRSLCRDVLSQHASTAERNPYLSRFYERLFQATGKPESILDLACGLHPTAFPWMGLPVTTRYQAYDIRQPRIDFINQFFIKLGLAPLAYNQDILVSPPSDTADLGIFFKEAHRFEKRQPGCNRAFWASLKVHTLAVSLPTQNLSGTHTLLDQHRDLVYANLPDHKNVSELLFDDEIVFIITKP